MPAPTLRKFLRLGTLLTLTLSLARASEAQSDGRGRIEGIVVDSVHTRPLAGVRVLAVGAGAPADAPRTTISDSAGRYHIDSLPPGQYVVGFESSLLDSLEIVLPARPGEVAPGGTATVDLAVPSASKLRAAVCPGITLPPETGALFGHVVSAETESPLAGAVIALAWWEMDVDRTTLRPTSRQRTASVGTDDGGWYRLCGVPTGTFLSMQLQHEGRTGPAIRALVDDTLGIAIRHLSFSASGSSVSADSGAADALGDDAPLSGTAMLGGVVRGTGDTPLASAEVRVRGASTVGYTDESGRYSLRGLPAGTQVLDVRRVGYGATETSVELRSGSMVTRDVRLQRIVNLDSIRVVATRSRYVEFDKAQKSSLGGIFLGPEEMEQQRVALTSDIIEKLPGFRVVGWGIMSEVYGIRGSTPCKTNIVINRAEHQPINDVNPYNIGAIAAFRQGDRAPPEYEGGCGVIVIWTKR
jgi:Carboxypeptidase regulatory-like domain